MDEKYDSDTDTLHHIARVAQLIKTITDELDNRATNHDVSKLSLPEKDVFDEATPALANIDYGSPAYHEQLDIMRPALEHHYSNNRHHPEHHARGIDGMALIDLVEMLAGWKTATEIDIDEIGRHSGPHQDGSYDGGMTMGK